MTEGEARDFVDTLNVSRGTLAALDAFVDFLRLASTTQNLISASTIETIWSRHIADSAQLVPLASHGGEWIDIGSGAGFPGLIVSAISERPVLLVEERSKRVEFLREAAEVLGVSALVTIQKARVERVRDVRAQVISARAVASLDRLFTAARHLAAPHSCWLLPKGAGAAAELEVARQTWQGDFTLVPSVTDANAAIVIARDVKPRAAR